MKKLLFVFACLAPATLFAQSAFDGTWRLSVQSVQFSGKPNTFSLKNGVYRCETCDPKIDVKADGADHKRTGSPYSDTVNVRAVDDHTIEVVSKKGSKVVRTSRMVTSEDGNMLTTEWSFVAKNDQQGNGKSISKRVAAGPEGAHKASGSWQPEKMASASESVLTVTYKVNGDSLSMTDLTGDSYTAKFDGKDYPYKGDPGITSVSLRKIDANTIEETDKRDGKVIFVSRMTVSPDGRTMKFENTDKLRDTTATFQAEKQ